MKPAIFSALLILLMGVVSGYLLIKTSGNTGNKMLIESAELIIENSLMIEERAMKSEELQLRTKEEKRGNEARLSRQDKATWTEYIRDMGTDEGGKHVWTDLHARVQKLAREQKLRIGQSAPRKIDVSKSSMAAITQVKPGELLELFHRVEQQLDELPGGRKSLLRKQARELKESQRKAEEKRRVEERRRLEASLSKRDEATWEAYTRSIGANKGGERARTDLLNRLWRLARTQKLRISRGTPMVIDDPKYAFEKHTAILEFTSSDSSLVNYLVALAKEPQMTRVSSLALRRPNNNPQILTGTISIVASFPKQDSDMDARLIKEAILLKREHDNLRKKALECLYAVAVSLPSEMQLQTMNFNDRKETAQNLSVTGIVPGDLDQLVAAFKDDLAGFQVKDAEGNDVRLFANVLPATLEEIPTRGNPMKRWTLSCVLEMNREKQKEGRPSTPIRLPNGGAAPREKLKAKIPTRTIPTRRKGSLKSLPARGKENTTSPPKRGEGSLKPTADQNKTTPATSPAVHLGSSTEGKPSLREEPKLPRLNRPKFNPNKKKQ
ncbi:MAG: hypothetical protein QGH51_10615 [Planctomycetota bacterium]|nr:hypothetical protein [Planctomycetota bacterium]